MPFAVVVDFIQFLIGLAGDILIEWILPQARAEMTEPRKRRMTGTDRAFAVAMSDPLGWFFILALSVKFWKWTLVLFGIVAAAVLITGFAILCVNRWDI